MLNRKIAPTSSELERIKFPAYQSYTLDNGTEVCVISLGEQDVFKLELYTDAGAINAPIAGLAGMTTQLMKRGTQSKTAKVINESFDFYGAFWDVQANFDLGTFTIYSLPKHFETLLHLMVDVLGNSIFPKQEFDKEIEIEIQRTKLNWEKTSFAANQYFRNAIFGNDSYGRLSSLETLKDIKIESIKGFYQDFWSQSKPQIILSGKVGEHEINLLNQTIGQLSLKINTQKKSYSNTLTTEKRVYHSKNGAIQSSIRMGKLGMTRQNPDYFKFNVLNTILGGYFGSRLQKNIREEKGFTYGISSSMVPLHRAGYWVVGTDVNKDNAEETISEIRKEIKLLQTDLVPDTELALVKNYLMGSFIGELTQAFDIAEKVKIIQLENLNKHFYDEFQDQILTCKAQELRDLANQYLNLDEMTEVIVG
jgi:predicted Zn-dependent peptidase